MMRMASEIEIQAWIIQRQDGREAQWEQRKIRIVLTSNGPFGGSLLVRTDWIDPFV
ncbi:hypothetical protein ES702_02413 [subsurface metagenome]